MITREQLYKQVWTTPMRKLAKEYGLSDVGLAKVCKKMEIPRPGVGYWAKLEAGKAPEKPSLPAVSEKGVAEVEIHLPEAPEPDPFYEQALVEIPIRGATPVVKVPDRLRNPHPLVVQTKASIRESKRSGRPDPDIRFNSLDLEVSSDTTDRALRIYDALLKTLERLGFEIRIVRLNPKSYETKTQVLIDTVPVSIAIQEKFNQRPHVLTKKEQKDQERLGWHCGPKFDHTPSGRLTLTIRDAQWSGHRQRWRDAKHQKVEDLVGKFILGIEEAARVKRANDLRWEQRRREEEAERQRQLERQRQAEEKKKKVERLHRLVENWSKAQKIREFLEAVEVGIEDKDEELLNWIIWAKDYAEELDPLIPQKDS